MSAQPIPSSDYTKAGVLDKWVKQPVDNSPVENSNGEVNYTEKWKGPYSTGKSILSSIKVGDTISTAHAALSSKQEQIAAPACPTRNNKSGTWKVKEIRVEELTAGDHCFLHIKYWADYNGTSTQLEEIDELNVWSIAWQSYSVTPEEFVSGDDSTPEPWSPSDTPPTADWSKKANFANIQRAMQCNPEKKSGWIVFTPDINVPDVRYCLNKTEAEVWRKIKQKRNAIWHYPVVTHQVVKKGSFTSSLSDTLGESIDMIGSLDSGCPYTFPSNTWTWIKVGDDVTQTKNETADTCQFTRRTTWMGLPSAGDGPDINYYGTGEFQHTEQGITNGRWRVASL